MFVWVKEKSLLEYGFANLVVPDPGDQFVAAVGFDDLEGSSTQSALGPPRSRRENGQRGGLNWSGGQFSKVPLFPSSPRAFEFYTIVLQASGNALPAARICLIVPSMPHRRFAAARI
jgi:hypothetical protein